MTHVDYNTDELEKVEQLKDRLKNVMPPEMSTDTHYIIKFLRARNGDVNDAEIMLRKNIDWRKKHKIDTICSWYKPPEVLEKYLGLNSLRICEGEPPVIFVNFGNLDIRGLLMCIRPIDAILFMCHFLEKNLLYMKEQSQKFNNMIDKWNAILNFENFPLSIATHKPCLEMLSQIVSVYEAHYPETLMNVFVINSSWYFQLAFAFVKPLIHGNTLKKVIIFGKDGWREEVLKLENSEELPAFLGGNKTDPDGNPKCYSYINHCDKVPECYYAINNKNKFASQPDVKELLVHRLSRKEIEIQVKYPDSLIEWEFETKSRDIAVSLQYKENSYSNSEPEEILPKNRYDTSICTETGLFRCEKPGTYFLEFDNRYSWMHQKVIYFRVKVVPPQELETQNSAD